MVLSTSSGASGSGSYVIVSFAEPVLIDQATGAKLVTGLERQGPVSSAELQLGRTTGDKTHTVELRGTRVAPLKMSEDPAKFPHVRVGCQTVQV